MNRELLELSAFEAAEGIREGTVDALELLDAYAAWVERSGDRTGAFLELAFDHARGQVRREGIAGEQPLAGVPMALKDILHVEGFSTTCGSRILEGYQPPYESTAVQKLRKAGALIYGKLNMDEFAMGSSNENSAYKPVQNPWDTKRAPGGSSGGCAAAVASRQTPVTLGTDTGGSIRQPAAFCGITGLKPTYGRVSRYGLVAFASSLDQIGPMARTAQDCALMLSVIGGHDPMDATSSQTPLPSVDELLTLPDRPLRIGLPSEYFEAGLDDNVRSSVETFQSWCRERGWETVEISLPHTPYTTATYYLIATAEASSNLSRYDGIRYGLRDRDADDLLDLYTRTRSAGFGTEVKRRIMLGTFALSSGYYDAYYGKAQRVRTLIRKDFERAFADVDLILTPTSPTTAFRLGERTGDPLQMYLSDIYTNACNLAGIPGISFPTGFDQSRLPIGAQLMAPPNAESLLLSTVHAWQHDTDHHRQWPTDIPMEEQ